MGREDTRRLFLTTSNCMTNHSFQFFGGKNPGTQWTLFTTQNLVPNPGYKTGTHPLGEKYVASVEAGYYTTALQPLEAGSFGSDVPKWYVQCYVQCLGKVFQCSSSCFLPERTRTRMLKCFSCRIIGQFCRTPGWEQVAHTDDFRYHTSLIVA